MKNYLILINNRSENRTRSVLEQFDHYKSWGQYLSGFKQGVLLHGGPVSTRVCSLMSKAGKDIEEKYNTSNLKAYMVLSAQSEEEIKNRLLACPAFNELYTQMNIFEIDMQAMV